MTVRNGEAVGREFTEYMTQIFLSISFTILIHFSYNIDCSIYCVFYYSKYGIGILKREKKGKLYKGGGGN